MNIEIACRRPLRLWQVRLAEALRARGHAVAISAGGRGEVSSATSAALAIQQRLLGPRPSLFDPATNLHGTGRTGRSDAADLVIALDGMESTERRVLEPVFGDGPGEAALLAVLAESKPPEVRVRLREGGQAFDVVTARLATEDRVTLSRSLDQVLARLVTLVVQAVERVEREAPLATASEAPRIEVSASSPMRHVVSGLTRKLATRLSSGRRRPNHWQTAYRLFSETQARGGTWSSQHFTILPDDGHRFYADPIPFEHDGRNWIFVEDYPYATGKGVIAVVEIDATGSASTPRIVLEQPCHLSYPYIIRHKGEIYMLPEMSGARRVQLFRADRFPDRWLPDRILLDDIVAADATPVEHEGRWWMFATLSDDGGSSWDQLALFHAPDLFGPWTPHADYPVLVDAGSARPAGAMWHEDGALMRVAQDCRDGYGAGLAICRVDRLDETGYAQTVVRRLSAPDGYGADGVHTLNRAGALEVIDLRFAGSAAPSRGRAVPLSPVRG